MLIAKQRRSFINSDVALFLRSENPFLFGCYNVLTVRMIPFTLQKTVFWFLKDALLKAERRSFAT